MTAKDQGTPSSTSLRDVERMREALSLWDAAWEQLCDDRRGLAPERWKVHLEAFHKAAVLTHALLSPCEHTWSEWEPVLGGRGYHVERKCSKCGQEQYDD
jgi:hypothetical protein